MNSKKFNIFAFILVLVMCAVSVYFGVFSSKNQDGLSSYELAIKNGVISEKMTELEYLESLYGKNGSNVTLEDVYNAYLEAKNLTPSEFSYTEFILSYYPDKIVSDSDAVSMVQNATSTALRSTVDICYSYYMDSPIIYVSESAGMYAIDQSKKNQYAAIGVSAGSGVIYQMNDTTAYIITNYHVVYCENYSSDTNYHVYYNETTNEYFTATEGRTMAGNYILPASLTLAPLETHFLKSYGIYVYGFQSEEYEISATFVGGSADNDIAVLKVEKNASPNNKLLFNGNYKEADINIDSEISVGQTIVAVGNPLLADTSNIDSSLGVSEYVANAKRAYIDALCLTSTSGEVSNVSETAVFESIIDPGSPVNMRLIRVSAAINSGNSGGGLYDTSGRLVGIVNGKIASEDYDNVGYAISLTVACGVADQVIAQCNGTSTTTIKAVTTNSLGFSVESYPSEAEYDSNSLSWKVKNNVVIENVTGRALIAGLKNGDIISSIKVGEKVYKVNFEYDVADILLMAKTTDTKIEFNIERVENYNFNSYTISLSLTSSCFENIS